MLAVLPRHQMLVAVLAATAGLAAAFATGTGAGLLLPVAALFLHADWRRSQLVFALLGIACAGSLVIAALGSQDWRTPALSVAAFSAVALCLGAMIVSRVAAIVLDHFERLLDAVSGKGKAPDTGQGPELVHPDDRSALAQAAARAFWSGIPQIVGYRQRQDDGSYRWAEFRADPGYRIGVAVDPMVSRPDEPWTTTEAFGETGDAVAAAKVIEKLHGAAFAFDASGRFTYATPIAQTSIAMTLEDLNRPLGGGAFVEGGDYGWKLGVHPDDYEGAAARLRHCLRTGEDYNYDYRVLRATGDYVWHRFAIRPTRADDGHLTGWYGIGFDIDVYKRTEAALRESEQQLRLIIDSVPAVIWSADSQLRPSYVSRRFTEVTGISLDDLVHPDGSRSFSLIHPEDWEATEQAISHSIATSEPYVITYRQVRADGSYRWTETRAEALRDEHGAIIQWYGVSVDIDDLVMAQEALTQRERALAQLVETLPAMIDCATPDGEPIFRSQQLSDFLGYRLEDLDAAGLRRLDRTLDTGVHPDDIAGVREMYARSLSTGEPYARKHRLRRFDGQYRWVETRAAAMRNADGVIVQWNVICLDIESEIQAQEDLRLAQESLAKAGQAASLAELSASIAHEVNQPLAAIVANSHACLRWLSVEPPNFERAKITAEHIIRDANSAAEVVSRIRALFKQSTDARRPISLANVLAEARSLVAEEAMRRDVRLDFIIAEDLPMIALDRIQIQQVLINLIRNGIEAMDGVAGRKRLSVRARRLEDAVEVDVSDEGPGIVSPDRIFDPFFTTKEQGMGMGLAICRSIVEAHGGRLWAENGDPAGATFTFTLPTQAGVVS